MDSLADALAEFHAAVRAGDNALDRIMAIADAIDPMHHRTAWKYLAARSSSAGELLIRASRHDMKLVPYTDVSISNGRISARGGVLR
jgi:hypothetical protein